MTLVGLLLATIPMLHFGWLSGSPRQVHTVLDLLHLGILGLSLAMALMPLHACIAAVATVHVVTNERVLTVSGLRQRHVSTVRIEDIDAVRRRAFRGGLALLVFEIRFAPADEGGDMLIEQRWHGIAEAAIAEALIRELISTTGARGGVPASRELTRL